ncbi:MAG: hypothetical protein U0L27_07335 [Ruminococcus sp.]|nr:hypothetical protein [Ruminococcus sp.]
MKREYENPTFELVRIQLTDTLLNPSTFTPEETICEDIVDDNP